LLTIQNGWGPFLAQTEDQLHLTQQQVELAVMELRDHDNQGLFSKLSKDMRKNFTDQTLTEELVQVYSVGDGTAAPGPVLLRRTRRQIGPAHQLRVSPSGGLVAVTIDQSDNNNMPDELLVAPADGSGKTSDLGMSAAYPDWSPDGKYVVYIRPANWHKDDKDILPLGVLTRRQAIDDKGALLDTEHLPAAEDLAGMTFDSWARMRVATDGRIFFSAMELSLPVTAADVPAQGTIFYYDPGRAATLTRVVPRGAADAAGNSPNYFELSPDARYVSIPYGDARVSVLDIAKGTAEIVQAVPEGNGKDLKLQSVPAWRTPTELTFIRPTADLQKHEIVRYSVTEKTATPISAAWPAGTLDVLTKPPEPATQPSSPGAK
jgi:dipeptidyl aminopeptidase/acylaminoacyl peptidase